MIIKFYGQFVNSNKVTTLSIGYKLILFQNYFLVDSVYSVPSRKNHRV